MSVENRVLRSAQDKVLAAAVEVDVCAALGPVVHRFKRLTVNLNLEEKEAFYREVLVLIKESGETFYARQMRRIENNKK